jgi:hypothetical protein
LTFFTPGSASVSRRKIVFDFDSKPVKGLEKDFDTIHNFCAKRKIPRPNYSLMAIRR